MKNKHTFVICAYKESPYLEECIVSLKRQTLQTDILMVTSTPNPWIQKTAEKYRIPLFINKGEAGITQDWNFGIAQAHTRYVTIAHQDDVYEPEYIALLLERMEAAKRPLIGFSDYFELRNGKKVWDNSILKIKRMMLLPLRIRAWSRSRFVRRRVLSLGDPICCPAVTFCLANLELPIFTDGFRSCEDWEAWEKISRRKGDFVYVAKPLMSHRIHEESATTAIIGDNARARENYIMYCKFWPKWIAGMINHFYNKSEKSNTLEGSGTAKR